MNALTRKHYVAALGIFAACFAWVLFLTQGLPIGDPDDWDHVLVAQDISWRELGTKLITPWSSSHLWTGQVDRINEMTNRRLVLTIVLKSIICAFGLKPFLFYILSEALFFAGTVSLLFLLLAAMTTSVLWAFVGTLFFALIPAHYPHVLWITDPITIVHCFMLIGVLGFLCINENLNRTGSMKDFLRPFLVTFPSGYLAIKAKEPALTFPLMLGFYSLTQIPRWKTQKCKCALVLIALAVLVLQIVPLGAPLSSLSSPNARFPKFHPSHIYRMWFQNYDAGYDNEPTTAFLSLEQLWPVSIARTFGFFLLWTWVIFCILYLLGRKRLKDRPEMYFLAHPLAAISVFWVAIEIVFMGFFQADPRYFSGTMIPLTILGVRLIYNVSQMYPAAWRRFLWLMPLGSVLWAVFYNNLSHTIYLRRLVGQRSNRFLNLAKHIYADAFPNHPQDLRSLALFYCATYEPVRNHPRMREVSYFVDMNYDAWNKGTIYSIEEFKEFAEKGTPYYVGFEKDRFGERLEVRLLAVVDGMNRESVFEQVLYGIRKKPQPLYILKYEHTQP